MGGWNTFHGRMLVAGTMEKRKKGEREGESRNEKEKSYGESRTGEEEGGRERKEESL